MKKMNMMTEKLCKINDMFKKLGCVNEDASQSMIEKQSLLEYYDTEGDTAYVYNLVPSQNLDSIGEFSYRDEFLGSNVGMVYTSGAYTNYKLSHPFSRLKYENNEYGGGLVKYRIRGGFQNFLIFANSKMDKDFNVPPMDVQISKFSGLDEELRKRYEKYKWHVISFANSRGLKKTSYFLSSGGDIVKGIAIATRESVTTSYAAHIFCMSLLDDNGVSGAFKKTTICAKYGVRGLLFYGPHDGPVAIFHNMDDIIPDSYITKNDAMQFDNTHSIRWKKFNHRHDDTQVNHVEFFFNRYFPDGEYIYTKQTRTHEGEILVKDKRTHKWVFIDTTTKAPLFGDIQFADADVFYKGKAPVKLNPEDDEIFVDKEGNMYADRNSTEPITDLRTYIEDSNFDDDWGDDDW